MKRRQIVRSALVAIVGLLMVWGTQTMNSQTPSRSASARLTSAAAGGGDSSMNASLGGVVTSAAEGAMEGVLVSAQGVGSTIRITVVSNKEGRYAFPRSKVGAGAYELSMRAVGYSLPDPGEVEIAATGMTTVDLKLNKVRDVSPQLSNAEWLMSIPQYPKVANALLDCMNCHTVQPIFNAGYNEDQWMDVLKRMSTQPRNAAPEAIVRVPNAPSEGGNPERMREMAKGLAEITSPAMRSAMTFATLPRPTGRATRVIYTEYGLPRKNAQPHDVVIDKDGMAWYFDFAFPYLGKLNPKTGEVVEYLMPKVKPDFPGGANGLELDRDGNLWSGQMYQTGATKFDRKTEKFTTYSPPPGLYNNDFSRSAHIGLNYVKVNGRDKLVVWFANQPLSTVHRVDTDTGKVDSFELYKHLPPGPRDPVGDDKVNRRAGHSVYGISVDSLGNAYAADQAGGNFAKVDYVTGKVTLYPIPTKGGGPKRMHFDDQDRLWFGDEAGNAIGVFETRTGKIRTWDVPTPWSQPYDAVVDKNEEIWTGGVTKDIITRFDTKTASFVEYLLPKSTNIRRVTVDNTTTPVTFWVGNNHKASIVKLEPIE